MSGDIEQRTTSELVSGAVAYQTVSPTRAVECAELLAEHLDELDGAELARGRRMVAWNRRFDDPEGAARDLHALADDIRDEFPAWAAQSEMIADALTVELEQADPAIMLEYGPADESWPRIPRAGYERNLAAAVAPLDVEKAREAVDRGLAALDADGPTSYPEPDGSVHGSDESDAAGMESGLRLFRAQILAATGEDPRPEIDKAIFAARRSTACATTPDQEMATRAEIVQALRMSSSQRAETDPGAALAELNQAVGMAAHEQLGETLGQRLQIYAALGDVDNALDDAEQAAALWRVEGLENLSDAMNLDVARLKLMRGDDPQEVLDLVGPIRTRMIAREDQGGATDALVLQARALGEAGRPDESVAAFSELIDGLTGEEHPGYVAQLHDARGLEFWKLERPAEAAADLEAASAGFADAGDPYLAAGSAVNQALTSHVAGDSPAALRALDRADELYDVVAQQNPVDVERAQLHMARADVLRESDPQRSQALLDSVIARAQDPEWTPIRSAALHLKAVHALNDGDVEKAHDLVQAGLESDPEHPGLQELHQVLHGED
ncbi:MAG: hypothetical protein QM774_11830 [Gordonia sp. (in: high G+C Gram-positive bacteria)]|uniref:hypothetical protein n=1 Tax=Gordonia sp. (in: high G+C Gram-positive bacteria) TaxID=84139 RepID=UPI0039E22EAE